MMRKLTLIGVVLMLSAAMSFARARTTRTFSGEIMDSTCAALGGHSAGYKLTNSSTPKDCTLACVKNGAKFVLYNAAQKSIYKLDDQEKPKAFAGEKVKVIGSYNSATKTIHVERIAAGS